MKTTRTKKEKKNQKAAYNLPMSNTQKAVATLS